MDSLENDQHSQRLQRAILSCAIVYLVWLTWFAPDVIQQPAVQQNVPTQQAAGSVNNVAQGENKIKSVTKEERTVVQKVAFAKETFETEELATQITTTEGALHSLVLQKYYELPVLNSWWGWIFNGMKEDWEPYIDDNKNLEIMSEKGALLLVGSGKELVSPNFALEKSGDNIQALQNQNGLKIRKTYRKTDNPFVFDINIELSNTSNAPLKDVWVAVADEMKGDAGQFMDEMRPHMHVDGGVETYSDIESLKEERDGYSETPSWFGIGSRYFMVAVAEQKTKYLGSVYASHFGEERFGSVAYFGDSIQPNETVSMTFLACMAVTL